MKLNIVFESGSRRDTNRIFTGDCVVRLGRHADNDCVFDGSADRTVSGFHAEIHLVGRDVMIVDNDSTNGVLVNSQWVERSQLLPGDTVELGKDGPSFKVVLESEPTDPPPDPLGSMDTQPLEKLVPRSTLPGSAITEIDSKNPFRPYPVARANTMFPHTRDEEEPEEPDEKIYGERTVGIMIKQALSQVGLGASAQKGTSKSTDYFEAMVDKKVKSTSSRLKKVVIAAIVFVVLLVCVGGYYIYRSRKVEVYQTTHVGYGDSSGRSIAAANRFAIFMLAGKEVGGQSDRVQGFCSAFAVTRDVLATNAHCVSLAGKKFTQVLAIMNGAPTNRYWVTGTVIHRGYIEGRISPDVGLVRIQGQLKNLVGIAPVAELGQVAPGAAMFLYGFPGRLNKEDAPEATFIKGDIGRVTTFEQRLGNFGENTLLQHSAFSSGGTSGSPIFNAAGHVIGINAGGYVEDGKALSGYNFAMRIDLINELLPAIRGAN